MDSHISLLIIEREHGEFLLLADMLEQVRGVRFQLTWCPQLEQALSLLQSGQFAVALLDYYWGEQSARELLNAAHSLASSTAIVVMTEQVEAQVDVDAIRLGASDYLIKEHINSDVLQRSLRYAIDRKSSEQRLTRLAHYDSLTDIPNRLFFQNHLTHAIAQAEREGSGFSLFFIDLNEFKQVNDTYGHAVGDALLRACAERLTATVRKTDVVARLGGDEFTLLTQSHDIDLERMAMKIIDALSAPFLLEQQAIVIGCSIGVARYPESGIDPATLLAHADRAMYRAKAASGNRLHIHTELPSHAPFRQQDISLKAAIARGELYCRYSIRRAPSGAATTVLVDALWQAAGKPVRYSSEFLPELTLTADLLAFMEFLFEQAFSEIYALSRPLGAPQISFSLPSQLLPCLELVAIIERIYQRHQPALGDIELVIAEHSLADSLRHTESLLKPLAPFAINFVVNGFGPLFSSLLSLLQLPISAIKVNVPELRRLTRRHADKKLIEAVLSLPEKIDKPLIAEGIASPADVEFIKNYVLAGMEGELYGISLTATQLLAALVDKQSIDVVSPVADLVHDN